MTETVDNIYNRLEAVVKKMEYVKTQDYRTAAVCEAIIDLTHAVGMMRIEQLREYGVDLDEGENDDRT